ncbi:MAG: hypothetical protein ABSG44_06500 [Thermodesulfobacteriota bacterium]|jgi:hypothetical protein
MTKSKVLLIPVIVCLFLQPCFGLTDGEIQRFQTLWKDKPVGERIALWAEKFIGVPYDSDPLGEYVSKATIVVDERMDCMYLTFRVVELALSHTPEEAIQIALDKRFHSKGVLKEGRVINYDDRFEYGEDMVESGKWGKEVTSELGRVTKIEGSRGKDFVEILSPDELMRGMNRLKSGDILFFATKPEKRKVGEIIGHIGIIKVKKTDRNPKGGGIFLIHASGIKERGGTVKKVLLKEYLSKTGFLGVKITRFE